MQSRTIRRGSRHEVAAALFLFILSGGATTIRLAIERAKADPSHRKVAGSGWQFWWVAGVATAASSSQRL